MSDGIVLGAKRSLSHVGGNTRTTGDPRAAAALAEALDVARSTDGEAAESESRAHVHGFHTYPARMHPTTAARLVEAFSKPRDNVLDPFGGSGTVIVEARLAGRRGIGVDVNPLAVRLMARKATPAGPVERERLVRAATFAADHATDRRVQRRGASRRYGEEDVALFEPHVLLELDGLRGGIDQVRETDPKTARDLELVLSSLLVKLSRKASDTSSEIRPRRTAAGYPTKMFVRKTEELARSFESIEPALSAAPSAMALEGDARKLAGISDASVDAIVTSPPYPGVYDYAYQHALRLRWLRLDVRPFEAGEIGAKRRVEAAPEGPLDLWVAELRAVFAAMARVLKVGGVAVVLIADSAIGNANPRGGSTPIRSDALVIDLARHFGLEMLAVASQERPHFHAPTARAFAAKPRFEHAIALVRRDMNVTPSRHAPKRERFRDDAKAPVKSSSANDPQKRRRG